MTLMETAQLLGNFGEFVGAIAVVGTLVYLAVQVGQSKEALVENTRALDENRKLTKADAIRQQTRAWDELNFRACENRETASTFLRGNRNLGDLDEVDQMIYSSHIAAFLNNHFAAHRMCEQGFLDQEFSRLFDQAIGDMLRQHPGMRTWWEAAQAQFPLREHVNALIERDSGAGSLSANLLFLFNWQNSPLLGQSYRFEARA